MIGGKKLPESLFRGPFTSLCALPDSFPEQAFLKSKNLGVCPQIYNVPKYNEIKKRGDSPRVFCNLPPRLTRYGRLRQERWVLDRVDWTVRVDWIYGGRS